MFYEQYAYRKNEIHKSLLLNDIIETFDGPWFFHFLLVENIYLFPVDRIRDRRDIPVSPTGENSQTVGSKSDPPGGKESRNDHRDHLRGGGRTFAESDS